MNSENRQLSLSFDVGHSSIGWAVLKSRGNGVDAPPPEILGCGVVTFPADDCLASKRRIYRRQRRHVRSTRQRIERMEKLLVHLGVFTPEQIKERHAQGMGHAAPWLLAGRLLAAEDAALDPAPYLLNWNQLWDVLRWYAHNRGYDGNRRWAGDVGPEEDEDTEKVENARALMREHGTGTMAETITAVMYQPHGALKALEADPAKLPFFTSKSRYKAKSAAFPREKVEGEVRRLLEAHIRVLPQVTQAFISLLMDETSAAEIRASLREMGIRLPKRFQGGLLFGQFVPRFDNRIITTCPVSGEKVCAKSAPEFRLYRWLMQLANVRVVRGDKSLPPHLARDERAAIHVRMEQAGYFTEKQFKDAVRSVTGTKADNLDTMLMHPDAEKALVLDPVKRLINSERVQFLWPHLPERFQKRAVGKWRQGKILTLQQMLDWCEGEGASAQTILAQARTSVLAGEGKKGKGKPKTTAKGVDEATLLSSSLKCEATSGRAPYARHILKQACDEVLAGFDPRRKCRANDPTGGEDKAQDGCLVTTEAMMQAALTKPVDHLTNNHLVRHRLLILERLVKAITEDHTLVPGGKGSIGAVSIEVNRDLKELSGKTAKQVAQDMGLKLANFREVAQKLADSINQPVNPGLIRKARVLHDLQMQCPYTGYIFEFQDLLRSDVDKDHIVPYANRPSNGLDSLVVTFKSINAWKGKRTAFEFVSDEAGKPVPGIPQLQIRSSREFETFVSGLKVARRKKQGTSDWEDTDDGRRQRRRKQLLLLPKWEEKDAGFLPRDLTVTSHLVRMGALVLQRHLPEVPPHRITSLPGSVTAAMRTGWKLMGALSTANPGVLESDGQLKNKTDIRDVTHLHHALDAVVLGLTNHYFPKNGRFWEALVRRDKQRTPEDNAILSATGLFLSTPSGLSFTHVLPPGLEENLRTRLAERRVVQHLPADMSGLFVEENTRGVERVDPKGMVHLKQVSRDPKTGKLMVKRTKEPRAKVIGLRPGKLEQQKGARVIVDNYGVAILDAPLNKPDGTPGGSEDRFVIIPFAGVWKRLQELRKLNGGKRPLILRNGMRIHVPQGGYKGIWTIFSVKNNTSAMALDMGWPDVVRLKNKTEGHKINVNLNTLLKNGLEVVRGGYTG